MSFFGVFLALIALVIGISYYLADPKKDSSLIERAALYFAQGSYIEEIEEQEVSVSKQVTISIENINGPIKITGTKSTNATITITKRGGRKKDFERVFIEKNINKNKINLKTIHSDHNRQKVSVGYELFVPYSASIELSKTINGSIAILDITGNIKAHTANGGISCHSTAGSVDAYSVNGVVRASVESLKNNDHISLQTVNGTVDIFLPENINTQLQAQTAVGGISSDFHLSHEESHFVGKQIEGVIGKNPDPKTSIELSTTNGSIHIRRLEDEK